MYKGPKICDTLIKPRVYKSTSRLIFTRRFKICPEIRVTICMVFYRCRYCPRFFSVTWRFKFKRYGFHERGVLPGPREPFFDTHHWMSESSDEDIAEKKSKWQLCGIELGNLRLEFLGTTIAFFFCGKTRGWRFEMGESCNFCEMSWVVPLPI